MLFTYIIIAPLNIVLCAMYLYFTSISLWFSCLPLQFLLGSYLYLASLLVIIEDWLFFRWIKVVWLKKFVYASGYRLRPVTLIVSFLEAGDDVENNATRKHRVESFFDELRQATDNVSMRVNTTFTLNRSNSNFLSAKHMPVLKDSFLSYVLFVAWIYTSFLFKAPLYTHVIVLPENEKKQCFAFPPGYIITSPDEDIDNIMDTIIQTTQISYYLRFTKWTTTSPEVDSWEHNAIVTHPLW